MIVLNVAPHVRPCVLHASKLGLLFVHIWQYMCGRLLA